MALQIFVGVNLRFSGVNILLCIMQVLLLGRPREAHDAHVAVSVLL